MKLVGLTGGIATGKSTVGRLLRERGVPVIDADQVARRVVEPGEPTLAALVDHFGPGILDADGRLDRAGMRVRISADPEARQALNGITHPAIRLRIAEEVGQLAAAGEPIVFVEAALLVEGGTHRMYPDLWVVSCDPATQLARLVARDDMDEAGARALIATQLPLADKEAVATRVIRNDDTLEGLQAQVDAGLDALRQGAAPRVHPL